MYVCMREWGACVRPCGGVTKHGSRSPSLTGANWVSDRVSINSMGIYAYQRCLLLM